MNSFADVIVIGGGPAGAMTAATLATAGHKIVLFDEKLAWEKPCGGGITRKALREFPFLAEAEVERNWIHGCELTSPLASAPILKLTSGSPSSPAGFSTDCCLTAPSRQVWRLSSHEYFG